MSLRDFLGRVLEKIKGKKEERRIFYRLPADPKVIAKYLDEAYQKMLAEVEAERDRLAEEVQKLKSILEQIDKKKKEQMALQAKQAEIEIKEARRRNTKIFLFANKKLPKVISAYDGDVFTDERGNPVPFLEGFGFRLHPTGDTSFFLVLTDGKVRRELPIGDVSLLPYLLDWNEIVQNLKVGVIPVYLNKEGEFIPRYMEGSVEELEHLKKNPNPAIAKMLNIDLKKLRNADPEIKAAFYLLYSRLNRVLSELKAARESEKLAEWEYITTELERAVQAKEAEILRRDLQIALNNLMEQYKQMAPMIIESQQAHLKAAGLEELVQTMYSVYIGLQERVKEMAEDPAKVAKLDILKDLEMLARVTKGLKEEAKAE